MKIKDIKNVAVKSEALRLFDKRFAASNGYKGLAEDCDLSKAFNWDDSPNGYGFWSKIDLGEYLPLPNAEGKQEPKKESKAYFSSGWSGGVGTCDIRALSKDEFRQVINLLNTF